MPGNSAASSPPAKASKNTPQSPRDSALQQPHPTRPRDWSRSVLPHYQAADTECTVPYTSGRKTRTTLWNDLCAASQPTKAVTRNIQPLLSGALWTPAPPHHPAWLIREVWGAWIVNTLHRHLTRLTEHCSLPPLQLRVCARDPRELRDLQPPLRQR